MTLSKEIIDSISLMEVSPVNANRLELPTSQISNYPAVKKALVAAGGKYKKNGFEFTSPAAAIKGRLCGGEAINDKKKYQFFATPEKLSKGLLALIGVKAGDDLLEPQAGQGGLSNPARDMGANVTTVELMPENAESLVEQGYQPVVADFLTLTPEDLGQFDKISSNPPFTKNQDIDHTVHAYQFLKAGGTMGVITSKSWLNGSQKKQIAFRQWLMNKNAKAYTIPAGMFKESGTNVETIALKIKKAA